MRILFLTAFYPPHHIGGWGQLVKELNQRLQARRHETLVVTSDYGVPAPQPAEEGVARVLKLEADLYRYRPLNFFTGRVRRWRHNQEIVRRSVLSFRPDVIFIHVMFNLSLRVAWQAEQLCPGRVVYYVADDWPHATDLHTAYWKDTAESPARKWVKRLIAPLPLRVMEKERETHSLAFEHVLCVSRAIRENLMAHANIPGDRMRVVYNGIDLNRFHPRPAPTPEDNARDGLKLLYAGSLVPHKGVHTAIQAMERLIKFEALEDIHLTIVGAGHPEYERRLRRMVAEGGLSDYVTFRERVARDAMPDLLHEFDVLVFPSTWEEPLARMTQEAMASGLVVVGTTTGGSAEILIDGETALTFEPEDPVELSRRIMQLYLDPALREYLASHGQQFVREKFDIEHMVDQIEQYLDVVSNLAPTGPILPIPEAF